MKEIHDCGLILSQARSHEKIYDPGHMDLATQRYVAFLRALLAHLAAERGGKVWGTRVEAARRLDIHQSYVSKLLAKGAAPNVEKETIDKAVERLGIPRSCTSRLIGKDSRRKTRDGLFEGQFGIVMEV